jgi:ribonuclease H|nr:MAG TPA: ribonuclease HI [Caudoviricetes sp.]DAX42306.1 MAG TPA: ribonuclease HI [Caudoviricetes sp.]
MKVKVITSLDHKGNPKGSGTAKALIIYVDEQGERHEKEIKAEIENDTRNALALKLSVEVLKALIKPCEVELSIDCKYIKNCINNGWLTSWQQSRWKKSDGKPPANVELWKLLDMSLKLHNVKFVGGDDGNL